MGDAADDVRDRIESLPTRGQRRRAVMGRADDGGRRCQSLERDESPCRARATLIVESDAGWRGFHCPKHAARVVRLQAQQVINGNFEIRVRKFNGSNWLSRWHLSKLR